VKLGGSVRTVEQLAGGGTALVAWKETQGVHQEVGPVRLAGQVCGNKPVELGAVPGPKMV